MLTPRIGLLVTGGIAAYKAPFLARELVRRGAEVRVALSASAQRFVGPLTFSGLLGAAPLTDLWDAAGGEPHVDLAAWADLLLVAPATANVLAKMAHGLADDVVSATLLCARSPVVVAPAMHTRMWEHAATQENVETLRARDVTFVGPVHGALASGEEGAGRMSEPEDIARVAMSMLSGKDLAGTKILVSAGPTHEPIDPVRFVGNRSSGKMGYAIAERAADRGARVVLVSGPVSIPAPPGVELVRVKTALEMQDAIELRLGDDDGADAVIMAAAVADYRPREIASQKMKKKDKGDQARTVELVRNPDILATLGADRKASRSARPLLVGFAVETEDLLGAAKRKLTQKGADLIVANHASVAFEGDASEIFFVDASGVEKLGTLPKRATADRILDRVARLLEPAAAAAAPAAKKRKR
ncbi:MAG: bifunctional phosphopantothenoylcysteine decarboxylase/phosphopantothenate--cysteine ligase CoaBC [Sandaracinus sp.]